MRFIEYSKAIVFVLLLAIAQATLAAEQATTTPNSGRPTLVLARMNENFFADDNYFDKAEIQITKPITTFTSMYKNLECEISATNGDYRAQITNIDPTAPNDTWQYLKPEKPLPLDVDYEPEPNPNLKVIRFIQDDPSKSPTINLTCFREDRRAYNDDLDTQIKTESVEKFEKKCQNDGGIFHAKYSDYHAYCNFEKNTITNQMVIELLSLKNIKLTLLKNSSAYETKISN